MKSAASNRLLDNIYSFIERHHLIENNSTIVLGLSGGPDSIFLLHLLANLRTKKNITLIAAHLDHEWRDDSADDVKFCRDATQGIGVRLVTIRASELSISGKFDGSQEELGRRMRRHFLEQVAREHGADHIALAHHLQDQEETFFIRLIRGATLTGLTAMRPRHGMYIRPLLEINKTDILTYLDAHNITYLTDPSNVSPDFLRNRIRSNVLPVLQQCDERFDQNFLQTLNKLKLAESELQAITEQTFKEITAQEDGVLKLNFKQLFNLSPYMQKRILMHLLIGQQVPFKPQESFLDEIIKFLTGPEGGTHQMHKTWQLVKKKEYVHIEKSS